MSRFIDLTGQEYGEWTVIRHMPNRGSCTMWECLCTCGVVREVTASSLRKGTSLSCGSHLKSPAPVAGLNHVINVYRLSAKMNGKIWDLLDSQVAVLISQRCYYCGIKPLQTVRIRRGIGLERRRVAIPGFVYNGIDRVDNSVGYTLDNCVPCCSSCNFMKQDMSKHDFISRCTAIASNIKRKPLDNQA